MKATSWFTSKGTANVNVTNASVPVSGSVGFVECPDHGHN